MSILSDRLRLPPFSPEEGNQEWIRRQIFFDQVRVTDCVLYRLPMYGWITPEGYCEGDSPDYLALDQYTGNWRILPRKAIKDMMLKFFDEEMQASNFSLCVPRLSGLRIWEAEKFEDRYTYSNFGTPCRGSTPKQDYELNSPFYHITLRSYNPILGPNIAVYVDAVRPKGRPWFDLHGMKEPGA